MLRSSSQRSSRLSAVPSALSSVIAARSLLCMREMVWKRATSRQVVYEAERAILA